MKQEILGQKKIVLKFDEFVNYSLNVAQIQVTPEMKPQLNSS
jgi:hypothetical protein